MSKVLLETEDARVTAKFWEAIGGDDDIVGDGGSDGDEYSESDGHITDGDIVISNISGRDMTKCELLMAVPGNILLKMDPASSGAAAAGATIEQTIHLKNTAHGVKPVKLRFRLEYQLEGNSQKTQHDGDSGNIW